jgi:hypothetical protein
MPAGGPLFPKDGAPEGIRTPDLCLRRAIPDACSRLALLAKALSNARLWRPFDVLTFAHLCSNLFSTASYELANGVLELLWWPTSG